MLAKYRYFCGFWFTEFEKIDFVENIEINNSLTFIPVTVKNIEMKNLLRFIPLRKLKWPFIEINVCSKKPARYLR